MGKGLSFSGDFQNQKHEPHKPSREPREIEERVGKVADMGSVKWDHHNNKLSELPMESFLTIP